MFVSLQDNKKIIERKTILRTIQRKTLKGIKENIERIKSEIGQTTMVVVSKYRRLDEVKAVYDLGVRDLAENRVQELLIKKEALPNDIRWHMIGHLQSNKVKLIAPFIHLIQSVDSLKLATEINKQALRCDRKIDILLQVHIAQEESKYGFEISQVKSLVSKISETLPNVCLRGLMGMATFTDNQDQVQKEFRALSLLFDEIKSNEKDFNILSIGMSSDYPIAIAEGSTLIRIGSKIFS